MFRNSSVIQYSKNVQKSMDTFPCPLLFSTCVDTGRTIFVHFIFLGSFCSQSECERRKTIWDACVAVIDEYLNLKKDFDEEILALTSIIGRSTQTYWYTEVCFSSCLISWSLLFCLSFPLHTVPCTRVFLSTPVSFVVYHRSSWSRHNFYTLLP
jgi:hypothetical protein